MNSYFRQYCGCEAVRPWQCNVPRNSISAFRACSRSRGMYHEQVEHVLPTHKKTGSPNFNATSYDASDAFFLRPYLTREEYAYWNSHLSHFSPSCACSCACASNSKDNTIVTYQYTEPPVCVQNTTGSPCLRSLLGCSVVRGKSASGNSRSGPKPFAPEKVVSNKNWGIKEANDPFYCHLAKTSCNKKNTMISKDKGSFDTASLKTKSIPLPDQAKRSSSPKNLLNSGDSTKKNHHELSAESRRRLSMKYLCGDRSFEENPSARVSPAHPDKVKTGSTVLSDLTGTLSATPGVGSANSLSLKRKSTSEPEHGCLPEEKSKRQCLDDDKHGNNDVEAPNETIDLNDTLQSFLSGPLAKCNSGHEESENDNSDRSREASRSPGVDKSRGMEMARDQHQSAHAGKDINTNETNDTEDGCEINGVNKANDESESRTLETAQTKNVASDGLADVIVKSKGGNQTPADGDRASERKVVCGDVINKEKPVQRNLLKNTQSSLLCGSYALDYKSLPKLISVLSTPMAKAVSSLTI